MTDIVERLRSLNADFLHEEAAAEIERLREALLRGLTMRGAQTAYFMSRTSGALAVAKAAEAEFDRRVTALLKEGGR